jgi:glycosyltransferase involved in cell wall biosynthesis
VQIGLVSAEFPPAIGGVGDHTARLAQELAARGHSVDVLTSAGNGKAQWPLHIAREIPRWDWRILWRVPRIARQRGWDVLHIQYQPAAYGLHGAINLLPLVLRRTKARPALVTTFHDLRVPYLFPKAGPLRRQAVRLLAATSDSVIAVAEEDLPSLQTWTSTPTRPSSGMAAHHVPLGNQLDAAPPAGFEPPAWRKQHALPAQGDLLGYLGFVNRSKGVGDLIQAVAELVNTGRDLRLVMIGEELGSADATNRGYLDEVRRLVDRLKLGERMIWTGFLDPSHISAWLRSVDIAVLPFVDGASLRRTSLIAAWSQGTPVVTTQPHSAASWLDDPSPAVTVPPGEPAQIAAAVAGLLDDTNRCRALSAGAKRVAQRFSWPEVTERTLAVYAAAMRRASGQ